ncbi:MAG: TIGR03790 family protein [Nibricoccus sp.]
MCLRLCLFTALLGCGGVSRLFADELAFRVVVVANSDDPESLAIAKHYMERRHIPPANLVALPMPRNELVQWREFIAKVYQPLQDQLVAKKWIQAIGSTLSDDLGRKKYAITDHKIAYLVVCRGVPLKIEDDPSLLKPNPPFTDRGELRTNRGAVDAELALLAVSGYPINAFVLNPLFNKLHPSFIDEAKVVKVSRLDGPTANDAMALVDNAILAEERGLVGRAYIDRGGQYPEGEQWLEAASRQIEALDFDVDVERSSKVFSAIARFDAPVLYFGWYANGACGPFTQPGFRFPPGAIALHIHSFSAQTLHSADLNWCGPLVAHGVTATFGNVHEPYLSYTHHIDVLMAALASGKNLGDAAYCALPALSWQEVVIGDPLYRPFARSFAEQWQYREKGDDEFFAYVTIREANRLVRSGQIDQAQALLRDACDARPLLPLAISLAKSLRQSGNDSEAVALLKSRLPLKNIAASQIGIGVEMARLLQEGGAKTDAVETFRQLLALESLSVEQRLALFAEATTVAESAGAADLLKVWKRAAELLSAEPGK